MKALIVDDEARVRKAVRLLVDWTNYGITEIEESDGGFDAIERIRKDRPAIVIMDMMMPEGSGIDLMAAVSEFASTVKFIVVSGRGDFEFMRETVRHGAIDYLLKPIEPDAINEAVARAAAQWRFEEEERKERFKQNRQLNEFKPVYGEKLLTSLIDEPAMANTNIRRLREEGLVPEGTQTARLALLQVDIDDKQLQERFGGDSDLLCFVIINVSNEFLLPLRRGVAFRHGGTPAEIIVVVWDEEGQMPSILHDINVGLFMTLKRYMHFGMSTEGAFPEALSSQYEEAHSTLWKRNALEQHTYIHAVSDIKQGKRISFSDWEEEWRVAVLSGNEEQLAAVSERWLETMRLSGVITPYMLEEYRTGAVRFCIRMLRESPGKQSTDDEHLLFEGEDSVQAPYANGSILSLTNWRVWSYGLMRRLSHLILGRQAHEKTKMSDIASFIEQNYQSELSLQDIAGRFFVSREYVSRKFKQEYGINFSDYISRLRVEKAKLLMVNPNLRVAKIGELVGFHDEKYFSKVFKKQEGISPKAYRSQLME